MAACGYSDLTVRDLIQRAGVSRRTFYQLFEDKLDCVLAAHERAFDRLSEGIVTACKAEREWPEKASAAIVAALDLAAASPNEARLIVFSYAASEPELAARGKTAQARLAAVLRGGRALARDPDSTLERTEQGLIGALMSIVGDCLTEGEAADLPGLKPELIAMVLTPYLGGRDAQRIARTAADQPTASS
jgi:AcrR family transcriptional regulator